MDSNTPVPVTPRLEVIIEVFKILTLTLLDSGAPIFKNNFKNSVFEEFFSIIQSHSISSQKLAILPVTRMTISTITREKSQIVTKYTIIPFTLLNQDVDRIFLVVPHLITSIY